MDREKVEKYLFNEIEKVKVKISDCDTDDGNDNEVSNLMRKTFICLRMRMIHLFLNKNIFLSVFSLFIVLYILSNADHDQMDQFLDQVQFPKLSDDSKADLDKTISSSEILASLK